MFQPPPKSFVYFSRYAMNCRLRRQETREKLEVHVRIFLNEPLPASFPLFSSIQQFKIAIECREDFNEFATVKISIWLINTEKLMTLPGTFQYDFFLRNIWPNGRTLWIIPFLCRNWQWKFYGIGPWTCGYELNSRINFGCTHFWALWLVQKLELPFKGAKIT